MNFFCKFSHYYDFFYFVLLSLFQSIFGCNNNG